MSRKEERLLRKSDNSLRNRLLSIAYDSEFVDSVATRFPKSPLFANLRAGEWYVTPSTQARNSFDTCYFKSTDGHRDHWSFSETRLNLHVLRAALVHRSVIVVDSTRQGKLFPDALSRTVPIWCAVMNCVLTDVPPQDAAMHLRLADWLVSDAERDEIVRRLPGFVQRAKTLFADKTKRDAEFASLLPLFKPLRCVYVCPTQTEPLSDQDLGDRHFIPVYCVSASSTDRSLLYARDVRSWTYVQGAGDDAETWARGLTPSLFWQHADALLDRTLHDDDLAATVDELVVEARESMADSSSASRSEDAIVSMGPAFYDCAVTSIRGFRLAAAQIVSGDKPLFRAFVVVGDGALLREALWTMEDVLSSATDGDNGEPPVLLCLLHVPHVRKDKDTWTSVFRSCRELLLSTEYDIHSNILFVDDNGRNAACVSLLAHHLLLQGGPADNLQAAVAHDHASSIDKTAVRVALAQLQSVSRHVSIGRNLMKQVHRLFMSVEHLPPCVPPLGLVHVASEQWEVDLASATSSSNHLLFLRHHMPRKDMVALANDMHLTLRSSADLSQEGNNS